MMRLLFVFALIYAPHSSGHAQFGPVPKDDPNHPDTNPQAVRGWFSNLQNRIGGSCCGLGDAYKAAIDEDASPTKLGRGHVISDDTGEKEIWIDGYKQKTRPALEGDLTFQFPWELMTKEKLGNPTKTAIVFLNVTNHKIDRSDTWPYGVYCVVPLPPSF